MVQLPAFEKPKTAGRECAFPVPAQDGKQMKTKPIFLVMSAPSGCDKSTLIDMVLQEYPDFQ